MALANKKVKLVDDMEKCDVIVDRAISKQAKIVSGSLSLRVPNAYFPLLKHWR